MSWRDGYGAVLSPCGTYRYSLSRRWAEGPPLVVCMLNPSTADAEDDDPTIRRCVAFAKRDGFAALEVVNLFAFRATDPKAMWAAERAGRDVVGPENNDAIDQAASRASSGYVVAAWGRQPKAVRRVRSVVAMLANRARNVGMPVLADPVELMAWGTTLDGDPRHPLYLRGTSALAAWKAPT